MACKDEISKQIQAAIALEKSGIDMYTKFAQASKGTAKQFFQRLAKEEETHAQFFSDILKNPLDITSCRSFDAIKHHDVFSHSTPTESYVEALQTAIKAEEKSYQFYKALAVKELDEGYKDIFIKMAQYEKGHMDELTVELEYAEKIGWQE